MKREIKFRAWDKKDKTWIDNDRFYIRGRVDRGVWHRPTGSRLNVELMQYTGLKDKNGKEIYEGDIVKLNHWKSSDLFDYSKPFVVKWEYGQINFKQRNYNNFIGSLAGAINVEIIGNIYENPELLK